MINNLENRFKQKRSMFVSKEDRDKIVKLNINEHGTRVKCNTWKWKKYCARF